MKANKLTQACVFVLCKFINNLNLKSSIKHGLSRRLCGAAVLVIVVVVVALD